MQIRIDKLEVYKTIQVLALAALIVHLIFKIDWLLYVSLGLLILPLVLYTAARGITWVWLKFSQVLGAVNSRIILGLIFFIVLTPMALIYTLMGSRIQLKRKGPSHYHDRNHTYTPKDLQNTW